MTLKFTNKSPDVKDRTCFVDDVEITGAIKRERLRVWEVGSGRRMESCRAGDLERWKGREEPTKSGITRSPDAADRTLVLVLVLSCSSALIFVFSSVC